MPRREGDRQLNLPVSKEEYAKVEADAFTAGLSVQNYMRRQLGLEIREQAGFKPGNRFGKGRKRR